MTRIVRILREQAEIAEAERQYYCVFQSGNAFDEPIQSWMAGRAILYPSSYCFTYHDDQFDAMVDAARAIGEEMAYLSSTGWYDGRQLPGVDIHTLLQLQEGGRDAVLREVTAQTENTWYLSAIGTAYYSRSGNWGILTDDDHSIVAGSELFIDALASSLDLGSGVPELVTEVKAAYLRRSVDAAWLPRLLRHVYGVENANRLLAEADFPEDVDKPMNDEGP